MLAAARRLLDNAWDRVAGQPAATVRSPASKPMSSVHQSELVPYSAEQMFALVNDIESYPLFLPWCERAWIIARGDHSIRAGLAVRKGKMEYSFTTDNLAEAHRRIEMRLVEGPFRRLHGIWQFQDFSLGCRISFDLEFEFAQKLANVALAPVFKAMTGSLVGAFRDRGGVLYGRG